MPDDSICINCTEFHFTLSRYYCAITAQCHTFIFSVFSITPVTNGCCVGKKKQLLSWNRKFSILPWHQLNQIWVPALISSNKCWCVLCSTTKNLLAGRSTCQFASSWGSLDSGETRAIAAGLGSQPAACAPPPRLSPKLGSFLPAAFLPPARLCPAPTEEETAWRLVSIHVLRMRVG